MDASFIVQYAPIEEAKIPKQPTTVTADNPPVKGVATIAATTPTTAKPTFMPCFILFNMYTPFPCCQ